MSENLTRSRRCKGRIAFARATGKTGKAKCSDEAQVRRPALYM